MNVLPRIIFSIYLYVDWSVMIGRIVALMFLVLSSVVALPYVSFIIRPEVQMILGTAITLYIILVDPIGGLLFGLALLVLYLRVYGNKFGLTWNQVLGFDRSEKQTGKYMNYITPEHLESAQNNIFSPVDYQGEMKGIKGVYGEEVYGAQGIDKTMPGFERTSWGESVTFDENPNF